MLTTEQIKTMLEKPMVTDNMPNDFCSQDEAQYLFGLISDCDALQKYEFAQFISAGGTGMVFKVKKSQEDSFYTALKIIRKKIYEKPEKSPFSEEELDALKELVHANILRQYEFVENIGHGTVAICSAFINNPQGMDRYVQSVLDRDPNDTVKYHQISPERLNSACETIISWFYQVAIALQYMHEQGFFHLDIKPTNILLQQNKTNVIPIITDMGSCINLNKTTTKRAHFTWAYAHPELTDMASNPGSVEGGGWRASADIIDFSRLPIYDLYALGKTMQQVLAVIENHFGEMSFSNYSFRYMHVISALLLDGKNGYDPSNTSENITERHKLRFVTDLPMGIHAKIFVDKKITSAEELVERLKRQRCDYSITALAEEFGLRNSRILNNTVGDMVPFSERVAKVFNHPTIKRLYGELQLGIMTEVYPGASHNRWSHSVGVYSLVLKYFISILTDPDNPLLKIIVNRSDIDHAILAAIFHDLGQTALGHDLEKANKDIFDHISYINKLISETCFHPKSLKETINEMENNPWGVIDFDRILSIINCSSDNPIDYVASDAINSPIDADKLDYIQRDSYYCGVAYGDGIDYNRILNSLTVNEKDNKIRLGYYAKGRTAISSMLLARYQLYGSVYWHHTCRCLHAMIFYATQLGFGRSNSHFRVQINRSTEWQTQQLRMLYYYRVICRRPWRVCWDNLGQPYQYIKAELKTETTIFSNDYALDFIYRFTDSVGKVLLEKVFARNLFKRIYSKSLSDIDIYQLQTNCENRVQVSFSIQKRLFDATKHERMTSQRTETSAELMVSTELTNLENMINNELFILVDFPQNVTMPKNIWPTEVGDSSRKLQNYGGDDAHTYQILESSNQLMSEAAYLRVYAEPSFFSIVTRYLHPKAIEACIKNVISI